MSERELNLSLDEIFSMEIEDDEESSLSYKMNLTTGDSIRGKVDDIHAVRQAVYKILNTPRYEYLIYSWDYGVEFEDLIGESNDYVCSEIETRIEEALKGDDRVESVDEFRFDTSKKGTVVVSFTVGTVFGMIEAEQEVII